MRRTTGAATNSKNPGRYPEGAPHIIDSARGAWVSGGGERFVDLSSGLGSIILGHADEHVNEAIAKRLKYGNSYPLPSWYEEDVAEKLCAMIPWDGAEMVRYSKNGRDATVAAVRLARAVTGREKCVYLDYHGADDMFMTEPPWNVGMVAHATVKGSFQEIALGDTDILADAACVILEPFSTSNPDDIRTEDGFALFRKACNWHGCMMILDEMVSFGRAPTGTGLGHLSIEPDLLVVGKCLANGLPLSAVVGPREYMERFAKDVFHSATHSGEVLALAAAHATLEAFEERDVPKIVNRFGRDILSLFESAPHRVKYPYPARMTFDFSREELGVLLHHGVLCGGDANWTVSHATDYEARTAIVDAFTAVLSA